MKPFTLLSPMLIALPGLFGWGSCSADEAALRVTSTTPDVNIKVRANDRYAIRLPGLQYAIQFEASCAPGFVPDSMLLSIADTRKRVSASEMQSDSGAGITMNIPAGQIAPLAVEGFCLAANDSDRFEPDRVTVRGVLSAQASLLCSDDNGQQIIYASRSLDVTLSCDAEIAE